MALKTCFRVLPLAVNCLKSSKTHLLNTEHVIFRNGLVSPFNFANEISVRFNSTGVRFPDEKPEKNITRVYYGVLTPQIRAVKWFSLSSSIVGVIAQPFLYREIAATGNIPIIVATYSFIGFFTLVTPILLHLITKKYVTQMDYDESTGKYIATTVNFLCMSKKTEFTPDQVHVPDVPGMFTTMIANGKAIFLDPRLFEDPNHYARIMGYDKPIDFKLYETSPSQKKE